MNQINWLEVFSSTMTYLLLFVIAMALLLLVSKKQKNEKSSK